MRYEVKPIGSPEKLAQFFGEKQHRNVILELHYVDKLEPKYKQALVEIAYRCCAEFTDETIREMERVGPMKMLWKLGRDGYLVFPIDQLCGGEFQIAELEALQQVIEVYKDERLAHGAAVVEEQCECKNDSECKNCHGSGIVVVHDEMTETERQLAERG